MGETPTEPPRDPDDAAPESDDAVPESGDAAPRSDARLAGEVLLDAVSYGVYHLDPDGHVVTVNDALTDLVEYDRDALVGSHVSRFLDAEDVVRCETALRNRLLGGPDDSVRLSIPVTAATGDVIPCTISISPVTDGGQFRGTVGVVREVDDPDAAADIRDVEERQQAFDALAEASADGIIMLDDDSVIRYANPAVERILGYEPEELVGGSKMTIIPERLRHVHAEALQRYLETGEKHIDWTYVELPGQHKDGHEVPLAISLNEFTHDGEHYFVGTFRDISARKEVERELERQNERLERFASMLAHELRNPLQVAQIYLDFVDDEDGASVGKIAAALERIDEIIEVLLMLARGGDEVTNREAVDLTEVAAEAWASIETRAVEVDVATSRRLWVNRTHLQQLLENLFRNAVEHGSTSNRPSADDAVEHGSTSRQPSADDAVEHGSTSNQSSADDAVEHADETITVRVGSLDDGFYVEDTGRGIPEDEREKVVEAGYSADDDGIGLGLTFVAELADAYGWEYAITESEEGGARFEFTNVETVADE